MWGEASPPQERNVFENPLFTFFSTMHTNASPNQTDHRLQRRPRLSWRRRFFQCFSTFWPVAVRTVAQRARPLSPISILLTTLEDDRAHGRCVHVPTPQLHPRAIAGAAWKGLATEGGGQKTMEKQRPKKWERHSAASPQKRLIYYKNQCEITFGASSENVIKIMVFGAFVVSSNT